jgi:hypothetical protein
MARRRASGLALSLAAGLLFLGCAAAPDPADASAPLLVHGVVHDYAEQPVASARVTVSVSGPAEEGDEYGDAAGPLLMQMDVTSDASGQFAIRLEPTDKISEAPPNPMASSASPSRYATRTRIRRVTPGRSRGRSRADRGQVRRPASCCGR